MAVAFGVCAVYLIAAFITDLRSMKIPNVLTVSAMLSGPVYHGVLDGWEGLFSLKGLGAGFLILLIMYFIGAVGAGDVKLFGALVPGPAYGLPCRALCILVLLPVSSVCLSCSGVGKR